MIVATCIPCASVRAAFGSRRADLDAFLVGTKQPAASAEPRADLVAAAAAVQQRAAGDNDAELAIALRSLARAANRMAAAIERRSSR